MLRRCLRLAVGLTLALTARAAAQDCNLNGVEDAVDVAQMLSADCDGDGVPDECQLAPPKFGPSVDVFAIDANARGIISADLNGDGIADVVTAHQQPGVEQLSSLNVFIVSASRRVEPRVVYDAGSELTAVARGDVDGDGDFDLVTANSTTLSIFVNRGDGSFETPLQASVPRFTRFVTVADLDGDALPELIATNTTEDTVLVLANEGGHAFTAPLAYAAGDSPSSAAVGDINGDGHQDVVVANRLSKDLTIFFGRGDGELDDWGDIDLGERPATITVADFDRDGAGEVMVGLTAVVLSLAYQEGEFVETRRVHLRTRSLDSGDVDRDGDIDIVAGTAEGRGVHLLLNDGSGGFGEVRVTSSEFFHLVSDDFDGDRDLDIALIEVNLGELDFLWNEERGVAFDSTIIRTLREVHYASVADVDGDGRLDVVTVDGLDSTISVLAGRGDGSFRDPVQFPLGAGGHWFSLALDDFNRDGAPDIVAGNARNENLSVLINQGAGEFSRLDLYRATANPYWVETGDFDADGFPDIAASSSLGGAVSVLRNRGDGTFEARRDFDGGRPGGFGISVADLDGDGHVDIVRPSSGSGDLSILYGRGNMEFDPRASVPAVSSVFTVRAADVDADGRLDLLVGEVSSVSVRRNLGDRTFAPEERYSLPGNPYSIWVGDLDRDGVEDLAIALAQVDAISMLLGEGGGRFSVALTFSVRGLPRTAIPVDLDTDGDLDLVSSNRIDESVAILLNQTAVPGGQVTHVEQVCTELGFVAVSAPSPIERVARATKYVVPARSDATLLPPLVMNVQRFPLHQEFLTQVFPDRFVSLNPAEYSALVARRASRDYYVGVISRLRAPESGAGRIFGFNVFADLTDPAELLTETEVRSVYDELQSVFELETLAYAPDAPAARDVAATWQDPGFPVILDTGPVVRYEPYTRAVGFGRVRLLTREEFDVADRSGQFSFQNILVLDFAPSDIEGVVGGVVTAQPQVPLSHLSIRTARRGAPNAFVADALSEFAPHAGQLVRLEVRSDDYDVRPATLEEAETFWRESRPSLSAPPQLDFEFAALPAFEEISMLEMGAPGVARFGGKATNLARLQEILDGPWSQYREKGFAVPIRYYFDFLRSNRMSSALDAARQVTYEEYLSELFASAAFQSDSEFRFQTLDALRDQMRDEGQVDPALIEAIGARVGEIFGTPSTTRVRFRSSSNVEDDIQFNGAGLYDSTSGCPQDDFDADTVGPSHCDPTRENERGISRALKRVWSSLWNFRAYEEREFFQVPHDLTAMGVLVNRTFIDEAAQGVAFTGNPSNVRDRRYTITVQLGEESVVSPEPGVLAERNLLEVVDGEVVGITRATRSTLTAPGEFVLSEEQLRELGALMAHIDANFPLETGEFDREQVLLDMEFKFMRDGELAVKQVRPFLLTEAPPPAPTFELEIPAAQEMCGVFALSGAARGPREEYELKARVELRSGVHELPTLTETFTLDLIETVWFGPDKELAVPVGSGHVGVSSFSGASGETNYRFTYFQAFVLTDERILEIEFGQPLSFQAEGDQPIERRRRLGEEFFTVRSGFEPFHASLGGVASVRFGSCSHELLPLFAIDAELEDGTSLHFEERFEAAVSLFDTGPASLVRAEVTAGAERRIVREYERLVYSAFRHNTFVVYWAVLDPPLTIDGVTRPVRAIEFALPEPTQQSPARAAYLDEDFAVITSPSVRSLSLRTAVDERLRPFRRGDVNDDATLDVADALSLLNYIFRRGGEPSCVLAADVDDDDRIVVSDAVGILRHLFVGSGPLPAPFASCGVDPSPGRLTCGDAAACDG